MSMWSEDGVSDGKRIQVPQSNFFSDILFHKLSSEFIIVFILFLVLINIF